MTFCVSKQKDSEPAPPEDALIELGESHSPYFSSDGRRFLFIGSKRPSHQHSQVYEFDFSEGKARRITFQDGENQHPIYLDQETIAYSSSTDEIKERPSRLFSETITIKKEGLNLYASDLYVSDRFGEDISRLTKSPGFDSFLSLKEGPPKKIIFSRQVGMALEIWEIDLSGNRQKKLHSLKESLLMHPHWNERKKMWFWIEQPPASEFSQLMMAKFNFKGIEALPLPKGNHGEFIFSSDGEKIIISSDLPPSGRFQIYGFDLATHCFWPLVSRPHHLRNPSLSSNQKDLLFVSDWNEIKKIYRTQVELSPKDCLAKEN